MKALTVRQPWAWAIIHGGKTIENRSQAWSYRGLLAIHAGLQLDQDGLEDRRIGHALRDRGHIVKQTPPWFGQPVDPFGAPIHLGAIIGVVDLVDVHQASLEGCCEPWGDSQDAIDVHTLGEPEPRYVPGGIVHLVLADPRPIWPPLPASGRLGLWDLTTAQLRDVVERQVLAA